MSSSSNESTIPVLDRERKCAKCGGAAIGMRWVSVPDTPEGKEEETARRLRLGLPLSGELIQRACQECGYAWVERPLDSSL